MKRFLLSCAILLPLLAVTMTPLTADVRTRERSAIKFEGMLGRMVGLFDGRAARDGIVSTTMVKGDRMATMNDTTGQIVDLSEEKVYDLDLKRRTYQVTTFEELRRRMREARELAEQQKSQGGGGLGGMLARRIKKDDGAKPRATILTIDHEVQEIGTNVDAASLAIPDGFKERK